MIVVEIYGVKKGKGRDLSKKISSLRSDLIVSVVNTAMCSEPYLKIFYTRHEVGSRELFLFLKSLLLMKIRMRTIFCPVPLIGLVNSDLGPVKEDCQKLYPGGLYCD